MSDPIRSQLRSFRREAGLTQQELAEQLGVTRQTIIAIEQGKYQPSLGLALKTAKLFRCRVEDIYQLYTI